MEHIEQIRELFYSNNIELAIQLIKGRGYNLRGIIRELYDKYVTKYGDYENTFELTKNGSIEMYKNQYGSWKGFRLWLDDKAIDDLTLNQCLDKMTDYLIENYG